MSQPQNGAGERRVREPKTDVTAIKVDKTGRYLLVLQPVFAMTSASQQRLGEELPRIERELEMWWQSGRKFAVLVVDPYLQLKIERADETPEGEGGSNL